MITECFLCARTGDTARKLCHKHHVYEGKNRQASERHGFYIYVCPEHHRSIHDHPKEYLWIKKITQKEYERDHTREEFLRIIGRNYL